jgi:RNA polymerase sigma-70 factor (ECF subfamily)
LNTLSATLTRGPLNVFAPANPDSLPTRRSLLSRLHDLGDGESWRTFFATYWRLIYNLARKSGLSDDQAQEVVQETVIAVARQMPSFRYDPAKGSFKHWLLLICRRRIHDHLRRLYSSRQLGSEELSAEEPPSSRVPADADLDEDWDNEWRENIFRMALDRVRQQANPKQYQAFDYCVLQDMRAGEVASMLGLSAAQVYLAKHRVSAAVKRAAKEIEAALLKQRCAD